MFSRKGQFGALALGLATIGAAIGTGQAGSSTGPLHCEIKAIPTNGAIALESVVEADTPLDGTYRFTVEGIGGSGNSHIQQGGAFSVGPAGTATLSRVTLGSHTVYDVALEVRSGDLVAQCEERIGGGAI